MSTKQDEVKSPYDKHLDACGRCRRARGTLQLCDIGVELFRQRQDEVMSKSRLKRIAAQTDSVTPSEPDQGVGETMQQLYEAAKRAGLRSAEGRSFEEWREKVSDYGLDDARQALLSESQVEQSIQPQRDPNLDAIWARRRDNFRELGYDEWRGQYSADIDYLFSKLPQSIQGEAETDSVNENQNRGVPRAESQATSKLSNEQRFIEHFIVKIDPHYERKHGHPVTAESGAWELLAFVEHSLLTTQREGGSVSQNVESPSPASKPETNYCPSCHMFSVNPHHCDNCGGRLVYRSGDDGYSPNYGASSPERQDVCVYLIRSVYQTTWQDVSRAEFLESMRSVGIDATEPRDFKRAGVAGRIEIQPPSTTPATAIAEGGYSLGGYGWDDAHIIDEQGDKVIVVYRKPHSKESPTILANKIVAALNTRASRTPLPQPDPWARFKEMIRIANTRPCPACQHSDVASDGLCAASVPLITKEPHGSKRCGCPCVNFAWASESPLPEDDQKSGETDEQGK